MIFFRKSLLRRIVIYFLVFALLQAVIVFYFIVGRQKTLPVDFFIGMAGFSFLYFLFVYWFEIARPLKGILTEIKALLTGRKYRRLFTNRIDEIGTIAHFFNEVTKNFEKISYQIKEGQRMSGELEIAGKIQKDILPTETPQVPFLDIVAKTRPAVELGGDNFDFIAAKENTFIYIGDVTGHGVPAAIIMTMVHTLIHSFVEFYGNAYDVVVQTNRHLKTRIKSTMFMTMLMLRWNTTTQKMSFVGAGHEHLLIYRAGKGLCDVMMTGGIALGMVPDNSKLVKETDLPLEKDDVVVLYSDGVTEARNMAGVMFGLERLKQAVELYAPQYGAEGIVFHVARDFSRFVQEHIQEDDVTLIALRYLGPQTQQLETATVKNTSWAEVEKMADK